MEVTSGLARVDIEWSEPELDVVLARDHIVITELIIVSGRSTSQLIKCLASRLVRTLRQKNYAFVKEIVAYVYLF